MDHSKKLFSNEWGRTHEGRTPESLNGAEQRDEDASAAAILGKDSERHIQAVDINGYIKGSLDDDASATEQGDEHAEQERVEKEAKANQR
jgi:hypothetical protein